MIDAESVLALINLEEFKTVETPILNTLRLTARDSGDASLKGRLADALKAMGIGTVDDALTSLTTLQDEVARFAVAWLSKHSALRPDVDTLPRGVTLWYLCYVTGAMTDDADVLVNLYDLASIGNKKDRPRLARQMIEVWKSIA